MGLIMKNDVPYGGGSITVNNPAVLTKNDLYILNNTYRGMIVYVQDEDQYYKLVNDLPQHSASWEVYSSGNGANILEMSDAEIDALFV